MQLTSEQHDAIHNDSRRLLLEAGAGSGKTMVLVERYCRLAEREDKGVGSIVAITFTERAAAEMRERVRRRLAALHVEAVGAGETERAEKLEELQRRSGSAWIGTIHSFCQRLIGQYATRCGLDPRFAVLDGDASDRLREQAFEEAATDFLSDPEKVPAPVAAMRLPNLRTIVNRTYEKLTSQGLDPELPQVEKPTDEEIEARINEILELAAIAADEIGDGLAANPTWTDKAGQHAKMQAVAALDPGVVRRSAGAVIADTVIKRNTACTKTEGCERYNEALVQILPFLVEAELGIDSWHAIGELVGLYHRRYTSLKEARSVLDFNDLERKALELVTGDGYVRARLHERIRHLMVDEFQDTNRLQMRLIEAVCGPSTSLFCVGDELQSIYRFRNADVEVFRETRERFKQLGRPEGEVLQLRGNFRSHPDVLASVNEFGRTMFPDYKPLTRGLAPEKVPPASPGLDGSRVEMIAVAEVTEDKRKWDKDNVVPDSDPPQKLANLAEIRLLARRLREMVDAGVRRGDIVVLIRATTNARRLRDELAAAGLDPYLVAGRGYFDNQQVEDMRRILAVIANPLDDESLIAMAASPAAMFTPDDLLEVANAREQRHEPLWHAATRLAANGKASPRIADLVVRVEVLRAKASEVPVDQLIEDAAEAFGFDLAVLAMDDGETRWANVRKLMDLAIAYEETEGRDLRGFVDHVEASATNTSKEAEAVTEAEGSDRVRIMTVHASKGLEFDVVAVPFTGRGLLMNGGGDNVLLGKPDAEGLTADAVGLNLPVAGGGNSPIFGYAELKAEDDDAASLEERRLAHVAFTRARKHLIITGQYRETTVDSQPQKPGVPIMRRLLAERNRRAGSIPAPPADAALETLGDVAPTTVPLQVVEPGDDVIGPVEGQSAAARIDYTAETEGATARPAGEPQPAALRKLSYASIATYRQCPRCFEREYVVGVRGGVGDSNPESAAPETAAGRDFDETVAGDDAPVTTADRTRRYGPGNALHRLLETSAAAGWQPVSDERIAAVLKTEGLTDEPTRRRLRRMIDAWFASQLQNEVARLRSRPEVPFLMAAGPETPDSIVRGVIDLLVDLPDGGRMVVDYKTDRIETEADAQRLMEGKYGLQRQIYSLATSTPDQPATTAYVFLGGPEQTPPPVIRSTADAAYLEEARSTVATIAAEMLGGNFEPSPDCPVCAGNQPR